MNIITEPDIKNNKTKNKLLITQRNQGIECSRGHICLLLLIVCQRDSPQQALEVGHLEFAAPLGGWDHRGQPSRPPLGASWFENQRNLHGFYNLFNGLLRRSHFGPRLAKASLYMEPTSFRWTLAVVVWRDEGQGSPGVEMALGARKIMHLPAHPPHVGPWFLCKTERLFPCPWGGGEAGLRKQRFSVSPWDDPVLHGDSCFAGGEPATLW